jgi:hypothetical protein
LTQRIFSAPYTTCVSEQSKIIVSDTLPNGVFETFKAKQAEKGLPPIPKKPPVRTRTEQMGQIQRDGKANGVSTQARFAITQGKAPSFS